MTDADDIAAKAGPHPAPPVSAPGNISVRMGLGSAIFQGLLVVLGVVLGFIITEWQSEQSQRREADLALAGIMEELAANRAAIAAASAYHGEHIAFIDKALTGKTPLDLRAFPRGFVAPAQTSTAAWTSASEIGALAHLPFDKVLSLSRVYAQQASYQQQQATVSNVLYTAIFEEGATGVLNRAQGLRALISTFLYREQQLETAYAQALGGPASKDSP